MKWTMWRKCNCLGTPPPLNFGTLGVHPLHTSVLGIWLTKTLQLRYFGCAPPPYFGSRIIVPWDIPSLCCSPLPPVPLSALMYFSFLECLASYRPFVVLCRGFEQGRHSSVDNTLTIQAFLLETWFHVIRLVYIVDVPNRSEKWIFQFFFNFF